MSHTLRDKNKLLARVRRIQGQATALARQLEAGDDCDAVLQQIAAIRGAVNGLMGAVIEGHVEEHLVHQPDADRRKEDMEPLLRVLRAYLK